jgi:hypothetical protein
MQKSLTFHLRQRDYENVQSRSDRMEIYAQKIRRHKNIESKHSVTIAQVPSHRQDCTNVSVTNVSSM